MLTFLSSCDIAEIGQSQGGLAMLPKLIVTAIIVLTTALGANAQETFRVTLLGTENPQLRPDRFGPGTLVEAGDQKQHYEYEPSGSLPQQATEVSMDVISFWQ
jgi:hypothetical protein